MNIINQFLKEEKSQAENLLAGKQAYSLELLKAFVDRFRTYGSLQLHAAKTMIGIANDRRRIAWITQIGKNFVHIVFPFREPHPDNLCFQKIAQVPGDSQQYNHHLRIFHPEDINEEVGQFMELAFREAE